MFEATLTVDTSSERRNALIEVYNRQLVEQRMASLGGALAFVLICLAAVSGYIRADEATKGYYTNRLRILAAAGVGGWRDHLPHGGLIAGSLARAGAETHSRSVGSGHGGDPTPA